MSFCSLTRNRKIFRGVVEYATSINVSLHKFMLHGHGGLIYTKKLQRFNQSFQQARKNAVLWSDGDVTILLLKSFKTCLPVRVALRVLCV